MARPAYGEERTTSRVDELTRWNMLRKARNRVGPLNGKRVGDFGCGYDATFVRAVLDQIDHATLIDYAIADDLKDLPKVTPIEAALPDAIGKIEDATLDVVLCVSVLEHVENDRETLNECHRVLAPGGKLLVHVPSWRGKRVLEFFAYKVGRSQARRDETNDHKRYYDPQDLWPLVRAALFLPEHIRCYHHQFGCSTMAIAKKE